MDFVKPITAAFDVEYAQRSGTPFREVLNVAPSILMENMGVTLSHDHTVIHNVYNIKH